MKPRKKRKSSWGYLPLIALLALCTIGLALFKSKYAPKPLESPAVKLEEDRLRLTQTCKSYMQACTHSDRWWLVEAQQPSLALNYELDTALTNIRNAIISSAGASPLAQQIASTFTNFLITEYMNGTAIAIDRGDPTPKKWPNTLEVCFTSENDFRRGSMPTTLWYREGWDAVMMGAIEWPRPMFDAMLMHEVGHAYWKRTKGQPHNFSHEWFVDEVTMHELAGAVFNHATQTNYSRKLDEICASHANATNAAEFLAAVSVEELLQLDEVIGVRNCGHDIRGAACMNHITLLGFSFIDARKGSVEDKILHYRWIIQKLPQVK